MRCGGYFLRPSSVSALFSRDQLKAGSIGLKVWKWAWEVTRRPPWQTHLLITSETFRSLEQYVTSELPLHALSNVVKMYLWRIKFHMMTTNHARFENLSCRALKLCVYIRTRSVHTAPVLGKKVKFETRSDIDCKIDANIRFVRRFDSVFICVLITIRIDYCTCWFILFRVLIELNAGYIKLCTLISLTAACFNHTKCWFRWLW